MAKIQLVVEIEERYYEIIKNDVERGMDYMPCVLIANGTPLPKGHGDLIDRDSLELDCDWSDYYDGFSAYSESQVRLAPTIIEADKEASDG